MTKSFVGVTAVVVACLGLSFGADDEGPLPVTPAPRIRQKLPKTAAYRPTFVTGMGEDVRGGTGFVVKASNKLYALTAAHIHDPAEWGKLKSSSFVTMDERNTIKLTPKPAFLGKAFDALPERKVNGEGVFDGTQDFAIWELPADAKVTVLQLAAKEPRQNQWVWVVGQTGTKPLLFYRAKVLKVLGGAFMYQQFDRFDANGFSGAPVVDAEGKVVGTMLGSDASKRTCFGPTVAAIRARVEELAKK
jgi:hypothetical protein